MKFPAKAGGDFEIVPSGNHIAICNAIVDLGLQPGSGQYPEPKRQVYVRFELPTERIKYKKDGADLEGPMSIGRSFTASMSEKANLRKFIESWFGKKFPTDATAADFDLFNLLGRKCLLNVTHTDKAAKTYANISNATPIPKGMSADYPQHNESLYYSLDDHNHQTFMALPEWLRKKIESRIQMPDRERIEDEPVAAGGGSAEFDDDIPF
jgi:hypothetical protein